MLEPVESTSWHHRHLASFQHLNRLLAAAEITEPTVIIVGPGAVTTWAAPLLNDAANEDTSTFRKLIGDAARYGDQALRRIPGMPLRSLEPAELTRALGLLHRLIVVDRSRRVLDAVARDVPHASCRCVDITIQPMPEQADVVVAFNIVCRLGDQAPLGMAHIAGAVRPGGWLLIDDRSAGRYLEGTPVGFNRVANKTWRRVTAGSVTATGEDVAAGGKIP